MAPGIYTHSHTCSQVGRMKHSQSFTDLFLVNERRLDETLIDVGRMCEILNLELRVEAGFIGMPLNTFIYSKERILSTSYFILCVYVVLVFQSIWVD